MAKDKRKVQQNRAKKMARDAAKKAARKRALARATKSFASIYGVTRAEITKAPILEALVYSSIEEVGMGNVMAARQISDARVAVGVFLIDKYCLGVKDAFLRVMSITSYKEMTEEQGQFEPVTPAWAAKLVRDAEDYARSIGFEPHPDARDAAIVLEGVDINECQESFTFGKDGKPFYFPGPRETPHKARSMINKLTQKLGPDGFNFAIIDNGADQFLDDDYSDDDDDGDDNGDGDDEDIPF